MYVMFVLSRQNETVFHFDFDCPNNRSLWNQLHFHLAEDLALPPPTNTAGYCFWLFEEREHGNRNTL